MNRASILLLVVLQAWVASVRASGGVAQAIDVLYTHKPEGCDTGVKAEYGDYLSIYYTSKVDASAVSGGGKVLQSHMRPAATQAVRLIKNEVFDAWVAALVGVCEGAKVTFVSPPELAYGAATEPPNVPAFFEVEITQISKTPLEDGNMFEALDTDKDGLISLMEFGEYFKKYSDDNTNDVPWGVFMKDDFNEDGAITWEEFSGPKGVEPNERAAYVMSELHAAEERHVAAGGDPLILPNGEKRPHRRVISMTDDGESDEDLKDLSPEQLEQLLKLKKDLKFKHPIDMTAEDIFDKEDL